MTIEVSEEILLKDTNLCYYDSSFLQLLKKHNIIYVSQILDDDLMNSVFLRLKSSAIRTRELKGFVSLVKYKYSNIVDPSIDLLDETFVITNPDSRFNRESNLHMLMELGVCHLDFSSIEDWFVNSFEFDINKEYTFEQVLRITYPYWSLEKINRKLKMTNRIELMLEQYDKKKRNKFPIDSADALKELKEQLVNLTLERDSLDLLIEKVKQQIVDIENSETIGGIKK